MQTSISIQNVIISLFNQFVENGLHIQNSGLNRSVFKNDQGIAFSFSITHYQDGYDNSGVFHPEWVDKFGITCHIIILASHRVFYAVEYNKDDKTPVEFLPSNIWSNTANHFSNWKSEGLIKIELDDLEAFHEANKKVPFGVDSCSRKVVDFGYNSCTMPIVKFVEIEHSPIDNKDPYFRKVDSIREIKVKMNIEG